MADATDSLLLQGLMVVHVRRRETGAAYKQHFHAQQNHRQTYQQDGRYYYGSDSVHCVLSAVWECKYIKV